MRCWILGAALFTVLATACSAQGQNDNSEPPIRRLTVEEVAAAERARADAATRYEEAMASAPSYRSEIRDYLIANADSYQVGYRVTLDTFRGLDAQFRCIHSRQAIARALADDWQLVKCDPTSAAFFRRHGKDRTCRDVRKIPDEFETLTLWFVSERLATAEDLRLAQTHFLYAVYPGVREEITADQLRNVLGSSPPQNLIFARSSTSETYEDFVLNIDEHMVMSFHQKKTERSCTQNARGWIISGRQVVTLDSPISDSAQMASALKAATAYLEAGS